MKMIAAELIDTGEKRDARGRKLMKAQHRTAMLAAYRQSGLTQKAFAAREGVSYSTLTGWLFAERREATRKPAFKEVNWPAPATTGGHWPMEIALPNGLVIRAREAGAVAELIGMLKSC
jgi:DNA-binding transcriptional regulator YiaG